MQKNLASRHEAMSHHAISDVVSSNCVPVHVKHQLGILVGTLVTSDARSGMNDLESGVPQDGMSSTPFPFVARREDYPDSDSASAMLA
jgi:hypothetical protein